MVPITVIILTFNEEINVPYAINSARDWAEEVIVVDSFSSDRTLEVAQGLGVNTCQHHFAHIADQRNWALNNLLISTPWVFFLDADETLTEELRFEISNLILSVPNRVTAFRLRHTYIFLGKSLTRATTSSWHIRLIRVGYASWVRDEGSDEHCVFSGAVRRLNNRLLHWNRKGLTSWVMKHDWYSYIRALDVYKSENNFVNKQNEDPDHSKSESKSIISGLKTFVWKKMPWWSRPLIYFFYRYIFSLGLLDGKHGFAYNFLHDLWFPLMVEFHMMETGELFRQDQRSAEKFLKSDPGDILRMIKYKS